MSDVVIQAKNLKKVYRLYSGPGVRFLDMFGLLRNKPGAYTEHAALDGIDLEIRRGEKVAFIGRNGAGKSTLLKLVTGVIEPTSGTLDVVGKAHALLQIGTGFHPDFTGRENVYGYLAQLGVTGREADRRYAEVVEFAELEEYIDQPVKTYSSGMAVRLMFSTSTAIAPELLVLDEVLGVGDAYFAQKSYDRMRDLTNSAGTTLLLVTHDVYSAVKICERLIWIDRGRVLMDGDGPTVVGAYEDSIRLQEEQRLRLKAQRRAQELSAHQGSSQVTIDIHAANNVPQPCPVYFSRIELSRDGEIVGVLPLDGPSVDGATLQFEGTAWGDATVWEGRAARAMKNFGSPFHKVAGTITLTGMSASPDPTALSVVADYWSAEPCELAVRLFVDGRETALGMLPPAPGAWATHRAVPAAGTSAAPLEAGPSAGRQGTGTIVVDAVRPLNAAGQESFAFAHGEPFELELSYRINQPGLRERPQVLIAFHRDGVQDAMRTISRDLLFDESRDRTGVVTVRFPRLPLANGTYSVTVMVAREGYYDEPQTQYFSINPGVYTCLTRVFDIVVEHGGIVGTGTGVVADAEWALRPTDASTSPVEISRQQNLQQLIEREFPDESAQAWTAVSRVLAEIDGTDLSALARHSPGLAGYNWTTYLTCSVARMVRALRVMKAAGVTGGRILDFGSYFGNMTLMCAGSGYDAEAIDSYRAYSPALDGCVRLMQASGARVLDFADAGPELERIEDGRYDAVICLGVIEHIPHTPRLFLETLNRVLAPGGVLILDTPNMAYLYTRQKMARGESVMAPLASQFYSELPFEGHHREYTMAEVRWMLEQVGHQDIHVETFNYSIYGLGMVSGDDLINLRLMESDPELREIVLSSSRKPGTAAADHA